MTAIEEPLPPPSTEAIRAAEPGDDLEHWLWDLRSAVATNPAGWTDADTQGEYPDGRPPNGSVAAEPLPYGQPEISTSEARKVGRHRTSD